MSKKAKSYSIISEELMNKIDRMNEEEEQEETPYKAKKRTSIKEEIFFSEEIYDTSNDKKGIGAVVVIAMLIALAAIGFVGYMLYTTGGITW